MLAGMAAATALPRARLMSAATFAQASALRLHTTTLAPWSASRWTMGSPMPLVEPVTSATLPVRSNRSMRVLLEYRSDAFLIGRGGGHKSAAPLGLAPGGPTESLDEKSLCPARGSPCLGLRRPRLLSAATTIALRISEVVAAPSAAAGAGRDA